MTDALPAPLVPVDVDLRGMEWMPYYGDRLGRSEFNARVNDATWRAGHNLWWAAWNNVPASSLPNDEVSLTRFADLGRDVKAFRRLRDDALHGFIECSDGRLYHPFLASLALAAWERRVAEREKKRKWRQRKTVDSPVPETGTRPGRDRDETVPEPSRPGSRDRSGTVEKTGEDRTGEDRKDSKSSVPNGTDAAAPPDDPIKALFDRGVAILGAGSRSLIGKARRDYGDLCVMAAIAACETEKPSDPASFFVKCLSKNAVRSPSNGRILPNEGVF